MLKDCKRRSQSIRTHWEADVYHAKKKKKERKKTKNSQGKIPCLPKRQGTPVANSISDMSGTPAPQMHLYKLLKFKALWGNNPGLCNA